MELLAPSKDLGELLREDGLISEEQLRSVRAMQSSLDKPVGRVLFDMQLITDEERIRFLQSKFRYEVVDIGGVNVSGDVLKCIPHSYAEKHRCVPLLAEDDRLVVAMEDPTDLLVLDEIKNESLKNPWPVLAPLADIERILNQYPFVSAERERKEVLDHELGFRSRLWWRILHPLCFLGLVLLPLAFFLAAVKWDEMWFHNTIMRVMSHSTWDIMLYLILGGTLWSILLWEIDGLIFGTHQKSPQ
ncbi:MAG TPA: hypothetical protein PKH31_05470 [Candidatus Sumerlaeota bacterium]|nr:hypothetical protein [Candidatus Sumerlaeota bacterium]